jgi:hypothetical protein
MQLEKVNQIHKANYQSTQLMQGFCIGTMQEKRFVVLSIEAVNVAVPKRKKKIKYRKRIIVL